MVLKDDWGTTDVFEEIPAILVVIVALFIFLLTIATSLISYSERKDEERMAEELESFCESVLSFEHLLSDSVPGRFDSLEFNDGGREKLLDSFRPDTLGFHYNVTVMDVGLYPEKYNWSVGEEVGEGELIRMTSIPVVISNRYGQHHPGIMVVTIWEG